VGDSANRAHPQLVNFVRALARAAAKEYVDGELGIGAADASPEGQDADDEGCSLRPVLKRKSTRRVDY
jgi:hypothetical protein